MVPTVIGLLQRLQDHIWGFVIGPVNHIHTQRTWLSAYLLFDLTRDQACSLKGKVNDDDDEDNARSNV